MTGWGIPRQRIQGRANLGEKKLTMEGDQWQFLECATRLGAGKWPVERGKISRKCAVAHHIGDAGPKKT